MIDNELEAFTGLLGSANGKMPAVSQSKDAGEIVAFCVSGLSPVRKAGALSADCGISFTIDSTNTAVWNALRQRAGVCLPGGGISHPPAQKEPDRAA
jgi:hypothetical protein